MIPDFLAELWARALEDPTAAITTAVLIGVQLVLFEWFRRQTRRPLLRQRKALEEARRLVAATDKTTTILEKVPAEVRSALERAFPNNPALQNADLRDELTPDEVLPPDYNARLDAAASGIFVAMGILGTFTGLSLSFLRIDFGQAGDSITPMISGMLIAFINSLFGVALSLFWTIFSRISRHKYDVACHGLEQTLELKYEPHRRGSQVLAALGQLDAGTGLLRRELGDILSLLRSDMSSARTEQAESANRVMAQLASLEGATVGSSRDLLNGINSQLHAEMKSLREQQAAVHERALGQLVSMERATASSSQELLEKLAPKLEESFKALVDLPFERLTTTVDDFRGTVDALAERNERTLSGFDAALTSLSNANDSLATAVDAAQKIVSSFDETVSELHGSTEAARGITTHTAQAAESILLAGKTIENIGTHFSQLGSALDGTVAELRSTSGALGGSATNFEEAAARLNASTEEVRGISKELSEEAIAVFRGELETFLHSMSAALRTASEKNVTAFTESSTRIIETVDDRVSDLTDRMSAELNTLAARLPEAAAEINSSAGRMRRQLADAVKSLETAVKTMDRDTTNSLSTRLKEYDGLVATAVGRFSGTLSQWTSHVDEMKLIVEQLAQIERVRADREERQSDEEAVGESASVARLLTSDLGVNDTAVP